MITMYANRLEMYKAVFPQGGIGAELGVQFGQNVLSLLTTQPKRLFCVDPWEVMDGSYAAATTIASLYPEIEMVRDWDTKWIPTLPDKILDWVYIDTLHTYDQTMLELELLRPKVKSIIAGHDFVCTAAHSHSVADEWGAGVMLAVLEVLSKGWCEMVAMTRSGPDGHDQFPSWAIRITS